RFTDSKPTSARRRRSASSAPAGSVRRCMKASAASSTSRQRLKSSSSSSPWSRSTSSARASAGSSFDLHGRRSNCQALFFTDSIFRRYRLIEDAFANAAVICESACAALRVALSARERASFHDAVDGPRREPERENMVGDVERHLRRKAVENPVGLVRHRKSVVLAHRRRGKVLAKRHSLLTIVK